MSLKQKSKFLSLILRHKPEAIGITLDEHGWAEIEELLKGFNRNSSLSFDELREIVASDEKMRYSFSEDLRLIRANQGHSIPVDVELETLQPPDILYHGTAERFTASIDREGLRPQSRLYVHLSGDSTTAETVGKRHGKPIIYQIASGKMAEEGYPFFRSVNGVWLCKTVPVDYIKKL